MQAYKQNPCNTFLTQRGQLPCFFAPSHTLTMTSSSSLMKTDKYCNAIHSTHNLSTIQHRSHLCSELSFNLPTPISCINRRLVSSTIKHHKTRQSFSACYHSTSIHVPINTHNFDQLFYSLKDIHHSLHTQHKEIISSQVGHILTSDKTTILQPLYRSIFTSWLRIEELCWSKTLQPIRC